MGGVAGGASECRLLSFVVTFVVVQQKKLNNKKKYIYIFFFLHFLLLMTKTVFYAPASVRFLISLWRASLRRAGGGLGGGQRSGGLGGGRGDGRGEMTDRAVDVEIRSGLHFEGR